MQYRTGTITGIFNICSQLIPIIVRYWYHNSEGMVLGWTKYSTVSKLLGMVDGESEGVVLGWTDGSRVGKLLCMSDGSFSLKFKLDWIKTLFIEFILVESKRDLVIDNIRFPRCDVWSCSSYDICRVICNLRRL